jgi:hypothetical protein
MYDVQKEQLKNALRRNNIEDIIWFCDHLSRAMKADIERQKSQNTKDEFYKAQLNYVKSKHFFSGATKCL